MSKHRNRAKLKKSQCGRDYHLISLNEWYPLYWDEGLNEKITAISPNGLKSEYLSVAYCLVNYLAPIMSK